MLGGIFAGSVGAAAINLVGISELMNVIKIQPPTIYLEKPPQKGGYIIYTYICIKDIVGKGMIVVRNRISMTCRYILLYKTFI